MEVNVGSPGTSVQIECSPGTQKMFENHPEILRAALSEAGVLNVDEPAAANVDSWFTLQSDCQPESHVQNPSLDQEVSVNSDGKKIVWLDAHVKLLLSAVEELRPKVGHSAKLKNKRKMWREIQKRFEESRYIFSDNQIETKFRSLERQYKKVKRHNKQTGRNRAKCPFESEITAIMGDRPSVFPELILGASGPGDECSAYLDDTPILPDNEISTGHTSESAERDVEIRETPSKKTSKVDVGGEFAMREAREEYYRKNLAMREENYRRVEDIKRKKLNVLNDLLDVLKNLNNLKR